MITPRTRSPQPGPAPGQQRTRYDALLGGEVA
jgi:hypothetical protein